MSALERIETLPTDVEALMREYVAALQEAAPGAHITRSYYRTRYSTYRVLLYVRTVADGKPTHALRISCDYNGASVRVEALVRLPSGWIGT